MPAIGDEAWDWLLDTLGEGYERALAWLGEAACWVLDLLGLKEIMAGIWLWYEEKFGSADSGGNIFSATFWINIILGPSVLFALRVAKDCDFGAAMRIWACVLRDGAIFFKMIAQFISATGIGTPVGAAGTAIAASLELVAEAFCDGEWPDLLDLWNLLSSLLAVFDLISFFPDLPDWAIESWDQGVHYLLIADEWTEKALAGVQVVEDILMSDLIQGTEAGEAVNEFFVFGQDAANEVRQSGLVEKVNAGEASTEEAGAAANYACGIEQEPQEGSAPEILRIIDLPFVISLAEITPGESVLGPIVDAGTMQKDQIEAAGLDYDNILDARREAQRGGAGGGLVALAIGAGILTMGGMKNAAA